jgi:hypothetical protein
VARLRPPDSGGLLPSSASGGGPSPSPSPTPLRACEGRKLPIGVGAAGLDHPRDPHRMGIWDNDFTNAMETRDLPSSAVISVPASRTSRHLGAAGCWLAEPERAARRVQQTGTGLLQSLCEARFPFLFACKAFLTG